MTVTDIDQREYCAKPELWFGRLRSSNTCQDIDFVILAHTIIDKKFGVISRVINPGPIFDGVNDHRLLSRFDSVENLLLILIPCLGVFYVYFAGVEDAFSIYAR
jgi:hypothetical protein